MQEIAGTFELWVEPDADDPRAIQLRVHAGAVTLRLGLDLEQAAGLAQRLLRLYYAVEPAPPAPALPGAPTPTPRTVEPIWSERNRRAAYTALKIREDARR